MLAGAAGRRRSLAFLALAVAAGEEGLSRDRALALLWPELDSQRARNNLKQVVFSLRHALGSKIIVWRGAALFLNPALIEADLWEYERSLGEHSFERAVARYGGPFLDGFSVPGLSAFERWAEDERERLARTYSDAIETLAERAGRVGDHKSAVAWHRKLAAIDPLSAPRAVALMRALADAGDVPSALRHGQVYERLLREELETEPSADVRAVAEELRSRTERVTDARDSEEKHLVSPLAVRSRAEATVLEPERSTSPLPTEPLPAVREATTPSGRADGGQPAAPARSRWRALGLVRHKRFRRVAIAFVAAVDVMILGFGGRSRMVEQALADGVPTSPTTVAVYPFADDGGSLSRELGRVTAELVATGLDGALGFTTVVAGTTPRAIALAAANDSGLAPVAFDTGFPEQVGARLVVTGRVVEIEGRLRVSVAMYDRARNSSVIARATAEGAARDLFRVVDGLAAQLLASRFPGAGSALVRVASLTTNSLPAAKAYFDGEALIREGRYLAATDALRDAVRLDPAFALAYYRLSHASELLGEDAEARAAAATAVASATNLSDEHRRLASAKAARLTGAVELAERIYSRLTLDYPTDTEAWYGLGETLFHGNGLRGRSLTDARFAFEQVMALDPGNAGAALHLARIHAVLGHRPEAVRWLNQAHRVAPAAAVGRLALHVRELGGHTGVVAVDRERLERTAWEARRFPASALVTSDALDTLRAFAHHLLSDDGAQDVGAYAGGLLAYIAAAEGDFAGASALLDAVARVDAHAAAELGSFLAVMPGPPIDTSALRVARQSLLAWTPRSRQDDGSRDMEYRARVHPLARLHRLGLVALRAGDTLAAARAADQLAAATHRDPELDAVGASFERSLRARLAHARGDARAALALLGANAWTQRPPPDPIEALDRLLQADLLSELGRDAEALRWYATIGEGSAHELPLLGYAALGMARTSERVGAAAEAARHYRRVVALWRRGDPRLRPLVAEAERRAAAVNANAMRR